MYFIQDIFSCYSHLLYSRTFPEVYLNCFIQGAAFPQVYFNPVFIQGYFFQVYANYFFQGQQG